MNNLMKRKEISKKLLAGGDIETLQDLYCASKLYIALKAREADLYKAFKQNDYLGDTIVSSYTGDTLVKIDKSGEYPQYIFIDDYLVLLNEELNRVEEARDYMVSKIDKFMDDLSNIFEDLEDTTLEDSILDDFRKGFTSKVKSKERYIEKKKEERYKENLDYEATENLTDMEKEILVSIIGALKESGFAEGVELIEK